MIQSTPEPPSDLIPTFQQFVDAKYNLQSLGPYDYVVFMRKMKEVDFSKMIYDEYLYDRTKSNKHIDK